MQLNKYWFWLFLFLFAASCTSKLTEAVVEEKVEKPKEKPSRPSTPCKIFADAQNPSEAREAHVIYRDFIRNGEYENAFPYWKKAFEMAPAADGQRDLHFTDGIKLYKNQYSQASSGEVKNELWSKIDSLYTLAGICYPSKANHFNGLKAFDLYYTFDDRGSKKEIYNLFTSLIDEKQEKTPAYVLNPFTDVLIQLIKEESIEMIDARKYVDLIQDALLYGLENNQGSQLEAFKIVGSYAPSRLKELETVKGFYSCQYYIDSYYELFLEDSLNCDNIRTVISRLKWGDCPDTNEKYQVLMEAYKKNCQVSAGPLRTAYDCLNNADYNCAIENFKTTANNTDEPDKKAKYILLISKIYYSHLRNFSAAREYALEALEYRPNWGEPYMLIGRLYASSGPLCGPGRGWDSQVVTWVAIDAWNKAKSVDPSVAAEANRFINQYTQYMPTKEDIFQNPNIEEGDRYFVPCWIQRSTIIRGR